jgi:hypothetical protein
MFPINLSPTAKMWLGGASVALLAVLNYLLKLEPAWSWIAPLITVIIYVDGVLTIPTAASKTIAEQAEKIARPLGVFVLAALCLSQSACISSAPIVPVTPQNQSQVTACQNTAAVHDAVLVSDIVLGVATTTVATLAATSTDNTLKNDFAVTGAVTGGLAAVGAAVAELTHKNFDDSKCTDVVGPLPAKKTTAWPKDWPAPRTSPDAVADVDAAHTVIWSAGGAQ